MSERETDRWTKGCHLTRRCHLLLILWQVDRQQPAKHNLTVSTSDDMDPQTFTDHLWCCVLNFISFRIYHFFLFTLFFSLSLSLFCFCLCFTDIVFIYMLKLKYEAFIAIFCYIYIYSKFCSTHTHTHSQND